MDQKKPRRRVDPREVDWRIVGAVTLVTLVLVGWYAFATSSGGDDEVSSGTTLPDVTTTTTTSPDAGPETGPIGPNPAAGPNPTATTLPGTPTTNPASVTTTTTTTAPPTTEPPISNDPAAPQPGTTHTVDGTLLIDSAHTIAPGQPCGGQGERYQDFQVGQTVLVTDGNGTTIGQGILESCTWDGTSPCPQCGPGYETGRPQFTYTVGGVPEVSSYVLRIAWAVWQPVPIEDMRAREWSLGLTMA